MLTGKALGEALQKAITAKGVSKAQLARDFGVKGPSVHDWIKFGRIDKRHIDPLVDYFLDVVPASHWGLTERTDLLVDPELSALMDRATPRSQAVLKPILEAAAEGRLTEDDARLLAQIASRFSKS